MAAGLAGVLLGAAGYTVRTSEATSYLSDDPRACVNCHIMREHYDSWQKSSHHAVASCNSCHVPQSFFPKYLAKARNGYHHSKAFTFQDFPEPIRIRPGNARILNNNCASCHRTLVSELGGHGGPSPRRSSGFGRAGGTEAWNCVRCHAGAGHGPQR